MGAARLRAALDLHSPRYDSSTVAPEGRFMASETTDDRSQDSDPFISREQVVRVLHRVGLGDDAVMQALDTLHFPAHVSEVAEVCARFGIYRDTLTDWLGGSP